MMHYSHLLNLSIVVYTYIQGFFFVCFLGGWGGVIFIVQPNSTQNTYLIVYKHIWYKLNPVKN